MKPDLPFSCANRLQTGALLWIFSDIHRVRNNLEVNLEGLEASHDPGGSVNTCFLQILQISVFFLEVDHILAYKIKDFEKVF